MVEWRERIIYVFAIDVPCAPLIVEGFRRVTGAGERIHSNRFAVLVPEALSVVLQCLEHFPPQANRPPASFFLGRRTVSRPRENTRVASNSRIDPKIMVEFGLVVILCNDHAVVVD